MSCSEKHDRASLLWRGFSGTKNMHMSRCCENIIERNHVNDRYLEEKEVNRNRK